MPKNLSEVEAQFQTFSESLERVKAKNLAALHLHLQQRCQEAALGEFVVRMSRIIENPQTLEAVITEIAEIIFGARVIGCALTYPEIEQIVKQTVMDKLTKGGLRMR